MGPVFPSKPRLDEFGFALNRGDFATARLNPGGSLARIRTRPAAEAMRVASNIASYRESPLAIPHPRRHDILV